MKCIITIIQNKRVAMPYLFGKYCLPMMKSKFPGAVKLYHIFHDAHSTNSYMTSNKDMGAEHVDKVNKFINSGKYSNAMIVNHRLTSDVWPGLYSLKLACELVIKEKADYWLCLEDDAIIKDTDCDIWPITLGSADIGLYQDTVAKEMINTAYFLGTNEFANRFINVLNTFKKSIYLPANKGLWDNFAGKGSLIEHLAFRASRKPVYLGYNKCIRHHPHPTQYKTTGKDVREWLKDHFAGIIDKDLDLLKLDFTD